MELVDSDDPVLRHEAARYQFQGLARQTDWSGLFLPVALDSDCTFNIFAETPSHFSMTTVVEERRKSQQHGLVIFSITVVYLYRTVAGNFRDVALCCGTNTSK